MIKKVKYNPNSNSKKLLEFPGLTVGKVYDVLEYKKSRINTLYDNIIIENDINEIKEYYMSNYSDRTIRFFEDVTLQYRSEIIDVILK